MDVALLLETISDGSDDYSRIALRSGHKSDHPLVVRTQYDDSNGLLASLTVKGSNEGKEEMYLNYRESDNHLVSRLIAVPSSSNLKVKSRRKNLKVNF